MKSFHLLKVWFKKTKTSISSSKLHVKDVVTLLLKYILFNERLGFSRENQVTRQYTTLVLGLGFYNMEQGPKTIRQYTFSILP